MSEINVKNVSAEGGVINWQDRVSLANYGAGLQRKAKKFVETAQKAVAKSSDTSKIATILSEITQTIHEILNSGDFSNRKENTKLANAVNQLESERLLLMVNIKALERACQQDCSIELAERIENGREQLVASQIDNVPTQIWRACVAPKLEQTLELHSLCQALDAFDEQLNSLETTLTICKQTRVLVNQTLAANMELANAIQGSSVSAMALNLQKLITKRSSATIDAEAVKCGGEDLAAAIDSIADVQKNAKSQLAEAEQAISGH